MSIILHHSEFPEEITLGLRASLRQAVPQGNAVANNTIIKIGADKNQNPTLDTLKKIAKALEISVDKLIK